MMPFVLLNHVIWHLGKNEVFGINVLIKARGNAGFGELDNVSNIITNLQFLIKVKINQHIFSVFFIFYISLPPG